MLVCGSDFSVLMAVTQQRHCLFCTPVCEDASLFPPERPSFPGGSEKPHSWLWTGCTSGTARVSAHLHSVSHARGGKDQELESESQWDHHVSISGRDEHLLHPSLLLPSRIHLQEGTKLTLQVSGRQSTNKHLNIKCSASAEMARYSTKWQHTRITSWFGNPINGWHLDYAVQHQLLRASLSQQILNNTPTTNILFSILQETGFSGLQKTFHRRKHKK